MISPWVKPGNFYKYISVFPGADRMDLCLQVATGLAYLHENQVVFGDLKAHNVLIDSDGVAKLTDFGLSVLEKSHGVLFSASQTHGGGSVRWMAPELFSPSADRSVEADVYALAMTFVEILTGNVPFSSIQGDAQVMFAVAFNHAVPCCPKRLKVESLRHGEWWRRLRQCWSRRPEARPKATDLSLLDQHLITRRTQHLSEQLAYALCYGHTQSGPLKNLDTNEDLPASDATMAYFVSERFEESGSGSPMQSKEAFLLALTEQYASASGTRQPSLDVEYVRSLQDRIDQDLDKRIQHVHRWITISLAHFPPENQHILALFAKLDAVASGMKAAAYICSAQCSHCVLLCLLVHGHANSEHSCGNNHSIDDTTLRIWRDLVAENAARRIRFEDIVDLFHPDLPNKDATVLGIEWQSSWCISDESLVLQLLEPRQSGSPKTWWVRLVRSFDDQDFVIPHRDRYFVQSPYDATRAEMRFTSGLTFGLVLCILQIFHNTTKRRYHNSYTNLWFYAAVLFEMLSLGAKRDVSVKWTQGKRLTYQDHHLAEDHAELYQEIRDEVRRLLNANQFISRAVPTASVVCYVM
ncbi:hypothetical protein FRC09_020665 [Ceratobasidium sp. 395]|nr:hypothetical protein FRC09_020665 [Ceratobasidium sp. 395]